MWNVSASGTSSRASSANVGGRERTVWTKPTVGTSAMVLRSQDSSWLQSTRRATRSASRGEPAADHAEHAAGEERPGLGVRVATRVQDALLLAAADHACDEVVHLAHVTAQLLPQLGILVRLRERLDPQLRHLELAVADRHVARTHLLEGLANVRGRGEDVLPVRLRLRP